MHCLGEMQLPGIIVYLKEQSLNNSKSLQLLQLRDTESDSIDKSAQNLLVHAMVL